MIVLELEAHVRVVDDGLDDANRRVAVVIAHRHRFVDVVVSDEVPPDVGHPAGKLVLVGEKFFLTRPMEEQLDKMANKKDVIFTGRLTPDRLNDVLGAAWAMTFVPYFEGFGIPIVEAMKCDIPVIASKVTSLPEIAGDAAIYASPESPGSIRDAMIRVVREKGLREELILRGRERCQMFSWEHTAEMLWSSIRQVLDAHA